MRRRNWSAWCNFTRCSPKWDAFKIDNGRIVCADYLTTFSKLSHDILKSEALRTLTRLLATGHGKAARLLRRKIDDMKI